MANELCVHCGKPLPDGSLFCPRCGASLGGTQPVAPPGGPTGFWQVILARLQRAAAPRYEVLELLGHGGMAGVYLADDSRLGRKVAIKVMSPSLMTDPRQIERFRQEARATAQLSHPNIVTIHEIDENEGLQYLVMAYVEGHTLSELLGPDRAPIAIPQAARWIRQIAEALHHAHRLGIVHRDIKPGNVLVNRDGNALVTDFGIAKIGDEPGLTRTGMMVGTPTYMSPEQCLSGEVKGASDQYALGVLAYQMLCGEPPFTGGTMAVLNAHVHQIPQPIDRRRSDCPPWLAEAISRMLEKDPGARWPSLVELAERIRGHGEPGGRGGFPSAHPPSPAPAPGATLPGSPTPEAGTEGPGSGRADTAGSGAFGTHAGMAGASSSRAEGSARGASGPGGGGALGSGSGGSGARGSVPGGPAERGGEDGGRGAQGFGGSGTGDSDDAAHASGAPVQEGAGAEHPGSPVKDGVAANGSGRGRGRAIAVGVLLLALLLVGGGALFLWNTGADSPDPGTTSPLATDAPTPPTPDPTEPATGEEIPEGTVPEPGGEEPDVAIDAPPGAEPAAPPATTPAPQVDREPDPPPAEDPPPAAVPPAPALVRVSGAVPSGARLVADGPDGLVPLSAAGRDLSPGTWTFTFEAEGYLAQTERVTLTAGQVFNWSPTVEALTPPPAADPPSPVEEPAPPVFDEAAAQARIEAALGAFAQAFETRSTAEVLRHFPTAPEVWGEDWETWRVVIENPQSARGLRATSDDVRHISTAATGAVVEFVLEISFTDIRNQAHSERTRYRGDLRDSEGAWVLVNLARIP